jgi:hypothetical protein
MEGESCRPITLIFVSVVYLVSQALITKLSTTGNYFEADKLLGTFE